MKRCLIVLGILILFASCDQVIFPEPQPPKVNPLSYMPEVLQGNWIDQDGDTLYVGASSFSYYDDLGSYRNVVLSDTSVLKVFREHYFYSTPVYVNEEKYWITYILAVNEDGRGFDLLGMDPDDVVKLARLQEITSKERDIKEGDSEYYLFAPRKRHYKKIISDTIFTKMISFKRIE